MVDYASKLKSDLLEQLKGKQHIEDLMEVIGEELQEVFNFFTQLKYERGLYSAVGKQLDGIGDIVGLTRKDAAVLAKKPITFDTSDDEIYRKYLIYKVLKNTCDCTYESMISAFKMFWQGGNVTYSENPTKPATIIMSIDGFIDQDSIQQLHRIPIIKAAGVNAILETRTEVDCPLYLGALNHNLVEQTIVIEDVG